MKRSWTAVAGVIVSLLVTCEGNAEWHVQHARVLHGVPRHHYGHQRESFVDSGVAVISTPATPNQGVAWLEQFEPWASQQMRARCRCTNLEELIPRPDPNRLVRPVQRKSFHFRRATLTAGHLQMQGVGLMVYDTGHIVANGRITNNGGPNNEFRGNNVTVRVRAYTAPVVQQENEVTLPINSALLWESQHEQYISRGRPQVVSLVGSKHCRSAILRRHFNELTHLEVEFEYRPDR